jgi:hypothetical protein
MALQSIRTACSGHSAGWATFPFAPVCPTRTSGHGKAATGLAGIKRNDGSPKCAAPILRKSVGGQRDAASQRATPNYRKDTA